MRSGQTTLLLGLALLVVAGNAYRCVPRSFGEGYIVCVCNATYCDGTPDNNPKVPEDGSFYWYVSSKEGLRMSMVKAQIRPCDRSSGVTHLRIDTARKYQKIFGFGGAFTDSVGINLQTLSEATQNQLLRAYYDRKVGSRYMLGRIPIGGTDFSTRPYTYDDHANDTTLQHFALAPEDHEYKIPYIKKALQLNPQLKFVATSWTAPPWMKTNRRINGFGFLEERYYQTYANYLVKFLDEYSRNGVDIWGITTGNEPLDAFVPFDTLNTMGWTPETVARWVADNLGPTIAASKHNRTLILALDDQRLNLPWYIEEMFRNEKAKSYVAGTAVHFYADALTPPFVLTRAHDEFPDKFILMTEAAAGSGLGDEPKVSLGNWDRGEQYMLSIIEYMNYWSIGWIDWNIALDQYGGPNWIQNFVDAPIIVNPQNDEFYKQPMYYALKHFSRFVDRGSIRIHIDETRKIRATAFLTPSREVVVVLYNANDSSAHVSLDDRQKGSICLDLPPRSMHTVIYSQSGRTAACT